MNVNDIIVYIMVLFAVLGAADRILGNRFGLGACFEEGIKAIGVLALSMVGMLCLAPVLADILAPVIVPVFGALGADPAMFVGAILANDMGGAPLAAALALDPDAGAFGGLIVGAMLGVTVVFTIPAAMGMIEREDRKYMASGVLYGVITIPAGAFAGGLAAGFSIGMLLRNLLPIFLIALLIAVGLWKFEDAMIKGFTVFGKFILVVITIGLIAGIVEHLTGLVIIPGMAPISDGFTVVADIAMILAGAFPMVKMLTRVLRRPLLQMGKLLRINETAAAGLLTTLANSIPVFGMLKEMDNRGKVINMAFATSAAFVFGDHLGFTAGFQPDMVVPVIVGKLAGGVSAVVLAVWMLRKRALEDTQNA